MMDSKEFAAWDKRVAARGQQMWETAGSPEGQQESYRERARELLAIEDNPHATTRPVADTLTPDAEPLIAVENQGEFPTLTDQGEEQAYPVSQDAPDWDDVVPGQKN